MSVSIERQYEFVLKGDDWSTEVEISREDAIQLRDLLNKELGHNERELRQLVSEWRSLAYDLDTLMDKVGFHPGRDDRALAERCKDLARRSSEMGCYRI